jgi:hypothetical protein
MHGNRANENGSLAPARHTPVIWIALKKTGGNADVCENIGVAEKAIRKLMKMRGMQIDGEEGAKASGSNGEPELQGLCITAGRIGRCAVALKLQNAFFRG